MKYTVGSVSDLDEVAKALIEAFQKPRVVLFYGEMGAGKTTFIKAICKALGVTDEVQSPTFALVNEYFDNDQHPVYHFDFYRINSEEEALDIGLYEYLDSGRWCFLEWPEKIASLLPNDVVKVYLEEKIEGRDILIEL